MGQYRFTGSKAAEFLERMTVVDTQALGPKMGSLSMLMLKNGTIKDDCIITKITDNEFNVVLNAGCKDTDMEHINNVMADEFARQDLKIECLDSTHSLLAVQGPKAALCLAKTLGLSENAFAMQDFMVTEFDAFKFDGKPIAVARCGYTGEDGFEVSVPHECIVNFTEALLAQEDPENKEEKLALMVGLGARDSLRLEAGLCLYGHDIDDTTSPIEATLAWTISKRRRTEGGFLGYQRVLDHLENGITKKRVGFVVTGKGFVREGAEILTADGSTLVGRVTSGGPAPSLDNKAIGMCYVEKEFSKLKTELVAEVRGKYVPIRLRKMPFVPAKYYKKPE